MAAPLNWSLGNDPENQRNDMLASGFLLAVSALTAPITHDSPRNCRSAPLERFEVAPEALTEIRTQLADDRWSADACERLLSGTRTPTQATSPKTGTVPSITLTPDRYAFGVVPIGTTASAEITLTNPSSGTVSFAPNYPQIASSSGAFSITSSTCVSSIEADASCVLTIVFAPTRTGTASGFLDIRLVEATGLFSALIDGRGGSESTHGISYTPANYSFGTVATGSVESVSIAVTNIGNSPVTFAPGNPRISSSTGHRIAESSCGADLSVGASCVLLVEYAPTTTGAHTAFLDTRLIESYSTFSTRITSTAQAPLTYTVSMNPASVDFGEVQAGQRLAASIAIQNTGTGAVTFTTSSPFVSGTQGAFRRTGTTCLASLPVGQQCIVDVEFVPTLPGAYNGWVDVRLVEASGLTSTILRAAVVTPEIFSDDFETPEP